MDQLETQSLNKPCLHCKLTKSLVEFNRDCRQKDGRSYYCRGCRSAIRKAAYNPIRERWHNLYRHYGVTEEAFNLMVNHQRNSCRICRKLFGTASSNRPNVDHCHTCGKIRGLLCQHCNQGIGVVRENQSTLAAIRDFLIRVHRPGE